MKRRFEKLMGTVGEATGGGYGPVTTARPGFKLDEPGGEQMAQADGKAAPANAPQLGANGKALIDPKSFESGADVFTKTIKAETAKLGLAAGQTASVEAAQQISLLGLSASATAAGDNAAQLAANGQQTEATQAIQSQQLLTRFIQEIQGLYLDIRLLPTKLLAPYARGLGLTTIS